MTREFIKEQMSEIRRTNQLDFRTFYIRYTSGNKNVTSNMWGKMYKFENALAYAERSSDKIGDSLPIELLVLINDRCVHCWTKNPLWNGVDYPEEDSHVYTNVPLVGKHWFIDPKDWLDIDNRTPHMSDGDSDMSDECPVNVGFLGFFKRIFRKSEK